MNDKAKAKRVFTALQDVILKPHVDLIDVEAKVFEELQSALISRTLLSLFLLTPICPCPQFQLISEYIVHIGLIIGFQELLSIVSFMHVALIM